jgi:hypothetical protein
MTEKLNWGLYLGQKVSCDNMIMNIEGVWGDEIYLSDGDDKYRVKLSDENLQYYKPILRSLDRMTLAEKRDLSEICFPDEDYLFIDAIIIDEKNMLAAITLSGDKYYMPHINMIDWLTAKGFSIRGEIEKGLAIKEEI